MTLVARNKILIILFILAIVLLVSFGTILIISLVQNQFTIPTVVERLFNLPDIFFLRYNFYAPFFAALVLAVYAIITLYILYVNFEKTQVPEIIYFTGFLIGCGIEGIRIILPAINIWADFSNLYVFTGKFIFFGRFIAIINLIIMAILSTKEDNQQFSDQSLIIICAAAALLANTIPIDTITIPSNCSINFGFEKMYLVLSSICIAIGFITMLLLNQNLGSPEYKKCAIGFLLLSFGYIFLTQGDCFIVIFIGVTLLLLGTFEFLWNLHKFYIWK